MSHPDEGLTDLNAIIRDFKDFCASHGAASETDTRAKVIDRILKDVCGWPESDISREDRVDSGYTDYILVVRSRSTVCVEAKREGISFTLPIDKTNKTYCLNGALVTDPPIKAAIDQVHGYCVDEGIRYAIATNGYAWIVFRAVRDDIPWRKGHARVFPSLEYITDHFTEFRNLLSYDAITAGSLHEEFGTTLRASRQMHRVIDLLFNADLPLQRNQLNTDLQPIIKLVFEDIADQESLDILRSCYIHTGTLKTVANDFDNIITESIPKFLVDVGARSVGAAADRSGFERVFKDVIHVTKGELFLLLGGIGSGKSTFLKGYQRTTGKKILEEKTTWFSIDFLRAPLELAEMEPFVWSTVLEDLRIRYKEFESEKRRYLNEVFASEIAALQSTVLADLKPGTHRFNQVLNPLLQKWQADVNNYVPRLIRATCRRVARMPVLFIDNVDQLAPEYQATIFLLAQRITRIVSCITVVALREESYYTASVQKAFTAYSSRKFHIASPHFRGMIGNRIEYAIQMLERQLKETKDTKLHWRLGSIRDFLTIVQDAMVTNKKIGRLIKAICYGNMRFALEMFSTFVTSGATDVNKMLKIYNRNGQYSIAGHEFLKAITLGDRAYYKEEQSPIANIFNVGSQKNSSHFTAFRILQALMSHRGEPTPEGRGYVELSRMLFEFDELMSNQDDFIGTINRLVSRNLVETNTRATDSVEGASHVRITTAGWYYIRYLSSAFAYLDLVLQDTPINDANVEKKLRDSVYQVNNLTDSEEHKLERVRARFARVEAFLDYLAGEEIAERVQFGLERLDTPLAKPIVNDIKNQFEQEKEWIDRRIRENRERFQEEVFGPTEQEDEGDGLLGLLESEDDESE